MPNPIQRSADILNELIAQAQTTAIGSTASAGNPGQPISVNLEGIGFVQGVCGGVIVPGPVQGILADGTWIILSPNAPISSQQRRTIRHNQPEEQGAIDVAILILQRNSFVNSTDSRQPIGPTRIYLKNSNRPIAQIGEIEETPLTVLIQEISNTPAPGKKYIIQTARVTEIDFILNEYTVYTYLAKDGKLLNSFTFIGEGSSQFEVSISYPDEWEPYLPYLRQKVDRHSIPVYEQTEGSGVAHPFDFPWRGKLEEFIRSPYWTDPLRPSWGMLLQPTKYQLKGKPQSLRFQLSESDMATLGFTRSTPLQSVIGSLSLPYVVQDMVDRPQEVLLNAYGDGSRLDELWSANKMTFFICVRGHIF